MNQKPIAMNTENFNTMDESALSLTRGGGFAYDVGRVLRFIGISGGMHPIGIPQAIADWMGNEAANQAENG